MRNPVLINVQVAAAPTPGSESSTSDKTGADSQALTTKDKKSGKKKDGKAGAEEEDSATDSEEW